MATELSFPSAPAFGEYKPFLSHAISHPAKMNTLLLKYLIQTFTKKGETVLDVMAGSGSTGVVAALHGRNAVCVELERKFYEWMEGVSCDGYSCHFIGCYKRRELEQQIAQLEKEIEEVKEADIHSKLIWMEKEWSGQASTIDEDKTPSEVLELWGKFQDLHNKQKTLDGLPKKPHVEKGCREKVEAHSMLTPKGSITNICGDSRMLSSLLKQADVVITSPPYHDGGNKPPSGGRVQHFRETGEWGESGLRYSDSKDNIGNLKHGSIDAVITSPPYMREMGKHDDSEYIAKRIKEGKIPKDHPRLSQQNLLEGKQKGSFTRPSYVDAVITSPPYAGTLSINSGGGSGNKLRGESEIKQDTGNPIPYSLNPDNIGNLPFVDAVITSPPYEGVNAERKEWTPKVWPKQWGPVKQSGDATGAGIARQIGYAQTKGNIGTLKRQSYLEAMLQVYGQMHAVLKEGGLACIVIKPFQRQHKIVDLPYQTWLLLERCGFKLHGLFKLRIKHPSFWRIIGYNRCDHQKGKDGCKLRGKCELKQKKEDQKKCADYVANSVPRLSHEYILICVK